MRPSSLPARSARQRLFRLRHAVPGRTGFTYDLTELGRHWRAYDRLMAHWTSVLPPGRVLEVPYEVWWPTWRGGRIGC